ncbi:aminotransferase [Dactylonectria estremocensis]|uniref:Aminotransferase n=1 Tax=Dactylonectria estremocensis TaxID=1079267 RepID=A0A9P9DA92_9HYPO|nr:aminotransferase [Dactylonectria estremocensis]
MTRPRIAATPLNDGNITKGSGYSIVFVKDGTLYTAKKGVLEGITRQSVFDARNAGIPVHLDDVPTSLAYEANEIFIYTTAGGVMPITKLDGESKGEVGPITKLIWDGYWAMHYTAEISYES